MTMMTQTPADFQDNAPWPEAPATTPTARTRVRQVLAELVEKAKGKLPESHGRIDKGVALVLGGDIAYDPQTGTALVGSSTDAATAYKVRGKVCECPDFDRAPQHICKHVAGVMLLVRLEQVLAAEAPHAAVAPQQDEPAATETLHGIPRDQIVNIQGKNFIKVAGLLALAHQRGLLELRTRFTFNDAQLALAECTAVFPFGTFTDVGDACEANVGAKVKASFRRVAATRATARALRQALNVGMVALEELSEE